MWIGAQGLDPLNHLMLALWPYMQTGTARGALEDFVVLLSKKIYHMNKEQLFVVFPFKMQLLGNNIEIPWIFTD